MKRKVILRQHTVYLNNEFEAKLVFEEHERIVAVERVQADLSQRPYLVVSTERPA